MTKLILVVEDNRLNQKVAERMLEQIGHQVDIVDNGLQAVEILKQNQYDLIIMDCVMPEMDGYQASREIRRLEHKLNLPRTPIIAVTANLDNQAEQQRCFDAGMDDFLAKPVRLKSLSDMIDTWLVQHSSARDDKLISTVIHDEAGIRESLGDEYDNLVSIFIKDAPRLLERVEKAVLQGDQDAIMNAAHTLRGSSLYLGAVEFADTCRSIQDMAKKGGDCSTLYNDLVLQLDRLKQALNRQ